MHRLERIVALTDEPEALALLGELRVRTGDSLGGRSQLFQARRLFESLLTRHPLAFADHAAKFYLGSGNDAERAWQLAKMNLANRETRASLGLAIRSAQATGHQREACALIAEARARFGTSVDLKPCTPLLGVVGEKNDFLLNLTWTAWLDLSLSKADILRLVDDAKLVFFARDAENIAEEAGKLRSTASSTQTKTRLPSDQNNILWSQF